MGQEKSLSEAALALSVQVRRMASQASETEDGIRERKRVASEMRRRTAAVEASARED